MSATDANFKRPAYRLHPRHASVLTAVLMSAIFAFIMSGLLTLINLGPVRGFIGIWMANYALAFLISAPTAIVVLPIVKKAVSFLTTQPPAA